MRSLRQDLLRMNLACLEELVSHFGYLVLFLGSFLEGETMVLLAGFVARLGRLDIFVVVPIAFLGSFSGDQLWFLLGCWKGRALLEKHPKWRAHFDKLAKRVCKYEVQVVLGFRFAYGFRILTPFLLGTGLMKQRRFVLWDLLSSAIWATVFSLGGYFFGLLLENLVGRAMRYERWALLAALSGAVMFLLLRCALRAKRRKSQC